MSDIRQAEQVFSVTGLTEKLSATLERSFPFVWVRGEITNFSRSAPGHIYFSLKDASSQLQCVWFSGRQKSAGQGGFDPLTGEVFEDNRPNPCNAVRNGVEILCGGSISVYRPRGQYQLVVQYVMLGGEGNLAQAFEERKRRYAALGYFSEERKRPLPPVIRRVALVTSPSGAAIHDFLRLVKNRGLSGHIRLFPVPVQGEGAAEKIAKAMAEANAQGWADVIVLIRGGGSLEDLWAFNEDVLTEAVYLSKLPVIAGIGHEIDFSLVDLTADMRAATPSHAAQILWPMRQEIAQRVDEQERELANLVLRLVEQRQTMLDGAARNLKILSPLARLRRFKEQLLQETRALQRQAELFLADRHHAVQILSANLAKSWQPAERLHARRHSLELLAKSLDALFSAIISTKGARILAQDAGLRKSAHDFYEKKAAAFNSLEYRFMALDPRAPLERGYAILYGGRGAIRSARECAPGDKLRAILRDGELNVKVEKIKG